MTLPLPIDMPELPVIPDSLADVISVLRVQPVSSQSANVIAVKRHYLHRKAPISFAYGLYRGPKLTGVVTFGVPPSRHLQISACPSDPSVVLELNRLWLDDILPANTESWFVARALKMLPPRIIVSYADPKFGHFGYVYRALNFRYAGWTDMERKTPRFDYIPVDASKHTRDAFRTGIAYKVRRIAKVKYWTVTGTRAERRRLTALCGWPQMDWRASPPPVPDEMCSVAPEGQPAKCSGSTTPPTLASNMPSPDAAASAAPNPANTAPGSHHSTGSSTKTGQREER